MKAITNSNRSVAEATGRAKWGVARWDLKRMIVKGGGARNDVSRVMLMYILALSTHAKPLLQVNVLQCWGQRKQRKALCPRYLQLTTWFLLQNNSVYATVVLLLVLRERYLMISLSRGRRSHGSEAKEVLILHVICLKIRFGQVFVLVLYKY